MVVVCGVCLVGGWDCGFLLLNGCMFNAWVGAGRVIVLRVLNRDRVVLRYGGTVRVLAKNCGLWFLWGNWAGRRINFVNVEWGMY